MSKEKKVAIIHDWLVTYAGAEKVLEQILNCYPDADIYSLVDHLSDTERGFIKNKSVTTSFIQKLPFSKAKYRNYLMLMPLAIEQFDLSQYDLVISSSHAVAKGVLTGPDQLHICYCHSPIRYAWDLQHQYLVESNMARGLKSFFARWLLHKIRIWDGRTSNGVDYFIANSKFISRRIKKIYRRDSYVVYPSVDTERLSPINENKEEFYVTCSRMVPYKKIDLIVETFTRKFPNKKLIVIGDGPDYSKIKALAGRNIEFLGRAPFDELHQHLASARAFVFAAEEDFGIAPLEAQSCGTPVIALGKGGALETVVGLDSTSPTGVFFPEQSVDALARAVDEFEENAELMTSINCRENALRFSEQLFQSEFKDFVSDKSVIFEDQLICSSERLSNSG